MIRVLIKFSTVNLPFLRLFRLDPLIYPSILVDSPNFLVKLFEDDYDIFIMEELIPFAKERGVKVTGILEGNNYYLVDFRDTLKISGKCNFSVNAYTSLERRLGESLNLSNIVVKKSGLSFWGALTKTEPGMLHMISSKDRVMFIPRAQLNEVLSLLSSPASLVDFRQLLPLYITSDGHFVLSYVSLGLEALDLIRECEGIPVKASTNIGFWRVGLEQ